MLTKTEKRHYLELAERRITDDTNAAEAKVNNALAKIDDLELRLEIDSLIGELVLEHEYIGYEIGRVHIKKLRKT